MAFNQFGASNQAHAPMAEINTTPLVDVMLVLLVVFLITAPLFPQAVGIELPQTVSTQPAAQDKILQLTLTPQGGLLLNGQPIDEADLKTRLQAESPHHPELQLQADRSTPYQALASVMALAQAAGVNRIAFVTQPQ